MTLGKRLRELRTEHKLSQAEMANIVRKSLSAYKLWENDFNEPNIDALIEIADYFNVTIDYLIGRSADRRENLKLPVAIPASLRGDYESVINTLGQIYGSARFYQRDFVSEVLNSMTFGINRYSIPINPREFENTKQSRSAEDGVPLEWISASISELENDFITPLRKLFLDCILENYETARSEWLSSKEDDEAYEEGLADQKTHEAIDSRSE